MTEYLLASKAGVISGRKLARLLGLKFHTDINKIIPNSKIKIRYGNWETSSKISSDTDVNNIRAIHRMSNKPNLWKLIGEEIIVPPYALSSEFIPLCEDFKDGEMALYFGRTKYHRMGTDIIPFYAGEEIPAGIDYVVPYMRVSREYRVHYLFGDIVKCFRKVNINPDADPMIRTSAFGWNFRRAKFENIKRRDLLLDVITKSAEIIGCNFGGFDVGWSPPWNKWILFEVNSAPALNSETLKLYTQKFKEVLNGVYKPIENNSRGESINS